MPLFKRFAQLNAGLLVGGAAFTAYHYPQFAKDPAQLVLAGVRGMRSGTTVALMTYDYMTCGQVTSEVHYRAANRLYKCFCKNGGSYIKMGQLFG